MKTLGSKVRVMKPVWYYGYGKVIVAVTKHYLTSLPKQAS